MDDLDADWSLIRGANREIALAQIEGVEDEWANIRGLPEWIYCVHEGYGINSMALWRYKPRGHRKGKMPGGRVEEFWTFQYDKLLWSGSAYTAHESCFSGRTFRGSTRNIYVTLEEAFKRLEAAKQKHLRNLHEEIVRQEKEIQERQKWIETYRNDIVQGGALVFSEDLLR